MKEKTHSDGLGMPKFAYPVPLNVRKQVSAALSGPSIEIVHLSFSRLKHLCRFEKGGYCKEDWKNCNSENCPQIEKQRIKTIFHQFRNRHACICQPNSLLLNAISNLVNEHVEANNNAFHPKRKREGLLDCI